MAWLLTITLLVMAFLVYKAIESNSTKRKIERLEKKAYKLYFMVKSQLEKDLDEQIRYLKHNEQPLLPDEDIESLENRKEYLQHIKGVEQKFVRLKEKYKHELLHQQLEIYTDWYEYTVALSRTEDEQKGFSYLLTPVHYQNTLKGLTSKRKAIERRFDRKLEGYLPKATEKF